jgi:hypothetical protein
MWLPFSLSQSMRLLPASRLEIEVDFRAMRGVVWLAMRKKIENEANLNRSATAKPTVSPGLKNRLFWFDLIRYGLQAQAGRRHRRTTRRD